jgi:hypothetical protein
MLRSLPMRKVPRNFTITARPAVRARLPSLNLLLRVSSLATAILLGFMLALDFIPALRPLADSLQAAGQPAAELAAAPAAEMAQLESEESPDIIFWGGMPAMGLYGKGGGGEGMGGAPAPGYGSGGGMPEVSLAAPDVALPEDEITMPELLPESEMRPQPQAEDTPADAEVPPELPAEAHPKLDEAIQPGSAALTGSGPILGVRPSDEQGRVEISGRSPSADSAVPAEFPLRTVQIVLAAVLVLTALPAWLLRRK